PRDGAQILQSDRQIRGLRIRREREEQLRSLFPGFLWRERGQLRERFNLFFGRLTAEPNVPPFDDASTEEIDRLLNDLCDRRARDPAFRAADQRSGTAAEYRHNALRREVQQNASRSRLRFAHDRISSFERCDGVLDMHTGLFAGWGPEL